MSKINARQNSNEVSNADLMKIHKKLEESKSEIEGLKKLRDKSDFPYIIQIANPYLSKTGYKCLKNNSIWNMQNTNICNNCWSFVGGKLYN